MLYVRLGSLPAPFSGDASTLKESRAVLLPSQFEVELAVQWVGHRASPALGGAGVARYPSRLSASSFIR